MRNGIFNSVASCMDGVVVLVAVRTSQSTTISSWSSYYIFVGGNVKLKSNYGYRNVFFCVAIIVYGLKMLLLELSLL